MHIIGYDFQWDMMSLDIISNEHDIQDSISKGTCYVIFIFNL